MSPLASPFIAEVPRSLSQSIRVREQAENSINAGAAKAVTLVPIRPPQQVLVRLPTHDSIDRPSHEPLAVVADQRCSIVKNFLQGRMVGGTTSCIALMNNSELKQVTEPNVSH